MCDNILLTNLHKQYYYKTYENEILVHWSKEMWITKKFSRRKHIEKLVKFLKTSFEIELNETK